MPFSICGCLTIRRRRDLEPFRTLPRPARSCSRSLLLLVVCACVAAGVVELAGGRRGLPQGRRARAASSRSAGSPCSASSRTAAVALARPAQADPLLRLPRRRAGRAGRRASCSPAASCCTSTSRAYVFHGAIRTSSRTSAQIAERRRTRSAAIRPRRRRPSNAKFTNLEAQYPALSLAVLPGRPTPQPADGAAAAPRSCRAGAGAICRRADACPAGSPPRTASRDLIVTRSPAAPDEPHLLIRSVVPTPDGQRVVVADLPDRHGRSSRSCTSARGTRIEDADGVGRAAATPIVEPGCGQAGGIAAIAVRQTVAVHGLRRLGRPAAGPRAIRLDAPVPPPLPADRRRAAQISRGHRRSRMGLLPRLSRGRRRAVPDRAGLGARRRARCWARSITSAVHELFAAPSAIQQGDFAHRIRSRRRISSASWPSRSTA